MRGLCLGSVKIYFFFVLVQVSVADYKSTTVCSVCNGYHVCGFKGSDLPACLNGHPCTREQYRLCVKMLNRNWNGRCDRPGIFPDINNSTNYYQCVIKENNSKIIKLPSTCPSNTSFDASTVRCLTEDEKNMLKASGELAVRLRIAEEAFHCRSSGVFPDPHDCKAYHVCDSKLEPRGFYCPAGTYFSNKTCGVTKTQQCVQQLIKQSNNQIKEANSRYKRLKFVLARNFSKTNSHRNLQDRIIKKSFHGIAGMRYKLYGVGEKSHPEAAAYTRETVNNVEKVIENILAKYNATVNDTYDLLALQEDIQSETINTLNNTHQMNIHFNIQPCSSKSQTMSFRQSERVPLSVTVILLTELTNENTKGIGTTATTQKGKTTETVTDENASSQEQFTTPSKTTAFTEEPLAITHTGITIAETASPTLKIIQPSEKVQGNQVPMDTTTEETASTPSQTSIVSEEVTSSTHAMAEITSTSPTAQTFEEYLGNQAHAGAATTEPDEAMAAVSQATGLELTSSDLDTATEGSSSATSQAPQFSEGQLSGQPLVHTDTSVEKITSTTSQFEQSSEELTFSNDVDVTNEAFLSTTSQAPPFPEEIGFSTHSDIAVGETTSISSETAHSSEEFLGDEEHTDITAIKTMETLFSTSQMTQVSEEPTPSTHTDTTVTEITSTTSQSSEEPTFSTHTDTTTTEFASTTSQAAQTSEEFLGNPEYAHTTIVESIEILPTTYQTTPFSDQPTFSTVMGKITSSIHQTVTEESSEEFWNNSATTDAATTIETMSPQTTQSEKLTSSDVDTTTEENLSTTSLTLQSFEEPTVSIHTNKTTTEITSTSTSQTGEPWEGFLGNSAPTDTTTVETIETLSTISQTTQFMEEITSPSDADITTNEVIFSTPSVSQFSSTHTDTTATEITSTTSQFSVESESSTHTDTTATEITSTTSQFSVESESSTHTDTTATEITSTTSQFSVEPEPSTHTDTTATEITSTVSQTVQSSEEFLGNPERTTVESIETMSTTSQTTQSSEGLTSLITVEEGVTSTPSQTTQSSQLFSGKPFSTGGPFTDISTIPPSHTKTTLLIEGLLGHPASEHNIITNGSLSASTTTQSPNTPVNPENTMQQSTEADWITPGAVSSSPAVNRTAINFTLEMVQGRPNTSTTASAPSAIKGSTTTMKPQPFRCPHVGYFRDPFDCHSFYRCKRITVSGRHCPNCVSGKWKLVASHHTCKKGRWFSSFFWKCVRSKPLDC